MTDGAPKELVRDLGPDAATRAVLDDLEKVALCGGRFAIDWTAGPWKGQRLTVYCQQPGCITTGSCTGPKFVPGYPQFDARTEAPRIPAPAEMVAGAREAAKKATGKDDPRTDKEIARHIGAVLQRAIEAVRSGGWSP
jgi:hypothetical protein